MTYTNVFLKERPWVYFSSESTAGRTTRSLYMKQTIHSNATTITTKVIRMEPFNNHRFMKWIHLMLENAASMDFYTKNMHSATYQCGMQPAPAHESHREEAHHTQNILWRDPTRPHGFAVCEMCTVCSSHWKTNCEKRERHSLLCRKPLRPLISAAPGDSSARWSNAWGVVTEYWWWRRKWGENEATRDGRDSQHLSVSPLQIRMWRDLIMRTVCCDSCVSAAPSRCVSHLLMRRTVNRVPPDTERAMAADGVETPGGVYLP